MGNPNDIVVAEIVPDARRIVQHVDADGLQMSCWTDPGNLQYMRRIYGARRDDDFAGGAHFLVAAATSVRDADAFLALEQKPPGLRFRDDLEIGPAFRVCQEGLRRRSAEAMIAGHLGIGDTFLFGAVVILGQRDPACCAASTNRSVIGRTVR